MATLEFKNRRRALLGTAATMLGATHALIQAPMAGAQDARLALAVSRAGALGSLPAAMWSAEQLGQQLALEEVLRALEVEFGNTGCRTGAGVACRTCAVFRRMRDRPAGAHCDTCARSLFPGDV